MGTARAADMLDKMNTLRERRGCHAVVPTNSLLIQSARLHSIDMMRAGYIFHSVLHLGHWSLVGEVVGVASDKQQLLNLLMNSPEHRDIILDCRYDKVALGFARDDQVWLTGRFYAR